MVSSYLMFWTFFSVARLSICVCDYNGLDSMQRIVDSRIHRDHLPQRARGMNLEGSGFGSSFGACQGSTLGSYFFTMDSPRSIFWSSYDLKMLLSSTGSSSFFSGYSLTGSGFDCGLFIRKSFWIQCTRDALSSLCLCDLSSSFLAFFSLSIWTMSSWVRSSKPAGSMSLLLSWLPTITFQYSRLLCKAVVPLNPGMWMGLFLFISFSRSSRSISSSSLCCFSAYSLASACGSFFSGLAQSLDIIFYLCCFHRSMAEPALLSMSSSLGSSGLSAWCPPFFWPAFQQSAIELWATLPLSRSTPFLPIQTIINTGEDGEIGL